MVAIPNINVIPPSALTSVESLHAWTSIVLQAMFPNATYQELTNVDELAVAINPFQITVSTPFQYRLIIRSALVLAPTWLGGNNAWTQVQELGSGSIPSEFLS